MSMQTGDEAGNEPAIWQTDHEEALRLRSRYAWRAIIAALIIGFLLGFAAAKAPIWPFLLKGLQ
jgi:hypothetical protein